MRNQLTMVVLLAAMGGGSVCAADKTRVDVYISDRDGSSQLLAAGKVLASGIFDKIGVHVNWRVGELGGAGNSADNESEKAFGIRTLEHAPASATSGALASARIVGSCGTEILVYKDRVRRFLDNHGNLAGVGAGYVLAHELAHVMQGVGRHSESGILKAQWSNDDFQEMIYHKLVFTSLDVDLIHQGLALQLASRTVSTASDSAER